jgi:hypothetical protein
MAKTSYSSPPATQSLLKIGGMDRPECTLSQTPGTKGVIAFSKPKAEGDRVGHGGIKV